jgi:hypothetical protein
MVLLLCFALAYAITGAAGQVGRDAQSGLQAVRRRSWSTATRRVANMRAAGPRHLGWWLWLAGATVYHTTRYTVRGTRRVGRSVRTGWSAGWQRGRDRYAERVARRTMTGREGGTSRTFAQRWRTTRGASRRTAPEPAPDQMPATEPGPAAAEDRDPESVRLGDDRSERGAGEEPPAERGPIVRLAPCDRCGVYVSGNHACTRREDGTGPPGDRSAAEGSEPGHESGGRQGAGATDRTGGTGMAENTGEAPNIEAARDALSALQAEADRTVARVDQLSGSLQSADLDAQTLGEVAEVLEAADAMKTAAHKALSGLDSRHGLMEEAVNATAHAAKTDWYRH